MAYKLEYLPSAAIDLYEAEAGLYEFSPAAADKFTDETKRLVKNLVEHPFMYQAYEDDDYFRSMPLPYSYRLFYHVIETTKTISIHRIIHGMRDLSKILIPPPQTP
jgi:plasmid stabilization system protein ParE